MAHEEKMKQMEVEQRTKEKQMELDHETMEKEKDRRKDLLVAEIKSAGFGAMQDLNQNKMSDFQDVMTDMRKTEEFDATMNLNREKEVSKSQHSQQKIDLEKQKLSQQMLLKNVDYQIAKENKNKYDVGKKEKTPKKKS